MEESHLLIILYNVLKKSYKKIEKKKDCKIFILQKNRGYLNLTL